MKTVLIAALAGISALSFGQLWDNGSFTTGTTHSTGATAPGGGQWSELQTNGTVTNTTLGFGVNLAAAGGGVRMADDFTVGAGGWNITSFTFWAYLTGSTTTSATQAVLEIWNGRPGDAGSSVIFGDTTTNRMASVNFVDIYRTGRAAADTSRHIQQIDVTASLNLAAGTYWADWAFVGVSFAPPVTLPGQLQKAGSNARQWNLTSWVDANDGASLLAQDMPFKINGTPVPEPATLTAVGLGALALIRRRRARRN